MKETILVFLILLNGMTCLGCGCSTRDLDEAIEDADEIFVGKIKKVEFIYFTHIDDLKYHLPFAEFSIKKITFEVEKKWKGSMDKFVTIYEDGTSCAFVFEPYDKYMVYAYKARIFAGWNGAPKIDGLTSALCSRTQPDPDRYPRYVDVDDMDEEQPYNDKADLDRIFPNPVRLINFTQLYLAIAIVGIVITIIMIIKKRLITLNTNGNPGTAAQT